MTTLRSSTVADILRRSAARWPARVALRFADRQWTYAELDAAVTRAAAHLLGLGLVKGDRVAAYGRNSDAYLIGFLACARAGLVHVPVNYNLTGDELAYLVEQSGSRVALADPALAGNLPSVDRVVRCATPTARSSRCPARCPSWTPKSATATWSSCSTPRARPRGRRAR